MTRALSPVVGIVLLVAITVLLAAIAGTVVVGTESNEPVPQARLSLEADAADDRIVLTHHGGDTLSTKQLDVRVRVDGRPLARQPPVPFFATKGFEGGPTGPFNVADSPEWSAGETAGFVLASTNAPLLDPGSTVSVTVSTDGGTVAELETKAE